MKKWIDTYQKGLNIISFNHSVSGHFGDSLSVLKNNRWGNRMVFHKSVVLASQAV